MAQEDQNIEPAFAWAIAFTVQCIGLFLAGCGLAGSLNTPAGLTGEVFLVSAMSFMAGAAVTAAMAAPQPKKLRSGAYPLRLRVAWSYMGLTSPPPYAVLRVALTALPLWILKTASTDLSQVTSLLAAIALVSAALPRGKRSVLTMGAVDGFFYVSGALLFVWSAVVVMFCEDHLAREMGVAAMAAVILLQAQQAREVMALRWKELAPDLAPPPALDLSRFQVSVEREAAPALPAPVVDGEELVGSGSFKVDAAKMVEKLRERQLAEPEDFILAWLRCAAASGATQIAMTQGFSGIELFFDGRPFSTSELAQPYQVLLEGDGAEALRGRHFAYGLLALQRLNLGWLRVDSSGPLGTSKMAFSRSGRVPEVGELRKPGTLIRVGWPAWIGWWRGYTAARQARLGYGLGPATFTLNGVSVPDSPADWTRQEKGGWRTAFQRRGVGVGVNVRVYSLGTFIEEHEIADGPAADAWLANDGLELNISQTAVLRGETLTAGFRFLRGAIQGESSRRT